MRLLDFTYAALVTTLFAARGVLGIGGANPGFEESQQIQRDQLKRMRDFLGPDSDFLSKRQAPPQTINFSNPAAQQFFVPGTSLPDGKRRLAVFLLSLSLIHHPLTLVNFDAGKLADSLKGLNFV